MGAGLLATWRTATAAAEVAQLGDAADANDPARRIEIPPYVPAPSTTVPFEPPAAGEILFPLALGAERTCYVLDNFGDTRGRCCGYYHKAVDIMADLDTPQVAVVDGVLSQSPRAGHVRLDARGGRRKPLPLLPQHERPRRMVTRAIECSRAM